MQVNVNEVPFRSDTERPLVLFVLNSMSASSCPHQWTTPLRPLPVHTTSHAPASPLNDDSLRKVLESPLRPTHSSNPPHHSPPCPHYRNRCHWHIPVWKQYPPVAEFQIVQTGGIVLTDLHERGREARQSPATILRRFQNHNALLS